MSKEQQRGQDSEASPETQSRPARYLTPSLMFNQDWQSASRMFGVCPSGASDSCICLSLRHLHWRVPDISDPRCPRQKDGFAPLHPSTPLFRLSQRMAPLPWSDHAQESPSTPLSRPTPMDQQVLWALPLPQSSQLFPTSMKPSFLLLLGEP